jgi:dihydrodipicolinate synthase/N-acetylneuraminate lyase
MNIIAGIGSYDTNTAYELAFAPRLRCRCFAYGHPYYNKRPRAALFSTLKYVADRVDIHVLFNVPSRTSQASRRYLPASLPSTPSSTE